MEPIMKRSSFSLRNVLFTDALTCLACGLLMLLGAGPLAALLHIPQGLLFYAGLSLLPCAALMGFAGSRTPRNTALVWLIVAGNALWALASLWLLLGDSIAPNALGTAFVALQAAVVAALTGLEIKGIA
jgi:hypothetical protein